jgi:septal ring factor EnvC (AmiA/AmiB activator)
MDAKTKIDQSARGAVTQAGLAAADELKELRKQIERLERRLAKLESDESKPAAKKTTAKKSETKKTPTTKKRTTVKKDTEKAPSPAPGRSIGGGSGRGSSAS